MLRLTVVTYVALGSALAKPSPEPRQDVKPVPYGGDPQPVPFQQSKDEPELITFPEGGQPETHTLPSGTYKFTSPNYPERYPKGFDATFTVIGDNDQDITVTCDPFRMQKRSRNGCKDFLSINGDKYCGKENPPTITASELNIRMKTNRRKQFRGFSCLVTIAPSTGGCRCGQSQMRVVGGSNATAGQFPWQAGLVTPGSSRTFCGGNVINNWYVLTAAHCTVSSPASNIQVLLGDLRLDEDDNGQERFAVQQKMEHPQYTSATGSGWDFALLKLDSEITFTNTISPVCLPPTENINYAGAQAIASGYGRVGAGEPQANHLQYVEVPVWEQSRCETQWANLGITIRASMICAGGYPDGGRSVCNGDSGGPLVTDQRIGSYELIGVVSFGRPCALDGWADVYGRVTEALSWIESVTSEAATCSP